jgi:hypothetical protein
VVMVDGIFSKKLPIAGDEKWVWYRSCHIAHQLLIYALISDAYLSLAIYFECEHHGGCRNVVGILHRNTEIIGHGCLFLCIYILG